MIGESTGFKILKKVCDEDCGIQECNKRKKMEKMNWQDNSVESYERRKTITLMSCRAVHRKL